MNITITKERVDGISINYLLIFEILLILVIVFLIVTIKMECIKIGYEIYNLSQEIEFKKLQLQNISEKYDEMIQPEYLYKISKSLQLNPPEPTKVYYVE
ncbi:MAG: hypothetical protein K6348_06490 [Deferribacterales bacterium]